MTAFYAEDLAYIHDVGYGDFADRAAPGLLRALRDAGIAAGRVVDLGCGPGRWLRALVDSGYEAIGVDRSPAFIERARARVPEAELHVASIDDFDLPPCDAVTALGEVFCYAAGDGAVAPPLDLLFGTIHGALKPGGLLLFDVIVAEHGEPLGGRHWRAGDDWAVLVAVAEDAARRRLTRDIVAFREVDGGYRRSEERHVQVIYKAAAVEAGLGELGFAVSSAPSYGAAILPPRRLAFTARKRSG
ncbi:MAG: class I SAM-dependent methyltransferase [Alphaproteobacteria bacterium]|nr:class I SAM-dependent methyltransferase [Alphaproteobacteria bacterium]